jgi:hypothetical protein
VHFKDAVYLNNSAGSLLFSNHHLLPSFKFPVIISFLFIFFLNFNSYPPIDDYNIKEVKSGLRLKSSMQFLILESVAAWKNSRILTAAALFLLNFGVNHASFISI